MNGHRSLYRTFTHVHYVYTNLTLIRLLTLHCYPLNFDEVISNGLKAQVTFH